MGGFFIWHNTMEKITLINPQGRIKVVPLSLYKSMPKHKYGLQPHTVKEAPKAVKANMAKANPEPETV